MHGEPTGVDDGARAGARADAAAALLALRRELARLRREHSDLQARSAALASITQAVGAGAGLEDVLDVALERAVELLRASDGAIYLLEPGGRHARGAVERPARGRRGARIALADYPHSLAAVVRDAVYLVTRDEARGAEPSAMDALGLAAALPLPLVHGGACVGLLYLSYADREAFPSDAELVYARTVADQCALAIERARVLDAEREARARAERAEAEARRVAEAHAQLTAIIGHDLRTPLSAIGMAAALLVRRGGLTPEQQVAVGRIASSAGRMASLIQDVLDFARARQGLGMSLRREPSDVAAICRTAVQEFGWIRPDEPPTLSVEGETEAPVDRTRLAQALSNLLANALQHGGAAPVSVSVRGEGSHVVCAVHNGGAPIPPEVLPHLFEPFRRGPRAADPGGSLGLGLFIVHEIVRGHGGAVEVESTVEAGTTFTLRLPRS